MVEKDPAVKWAFTTLLQLFHAVISVRLSSTTLCSALKISTMDTDYTGSPAIFLQNQEEIPWKANDLSQQIVTIS